MAIKREADRMQQEKPKASDLRTFLPASLLFFVFCLVYLWLVVQPHLIYYCFGTILTDTHQFAAGWSPAREALGVPGGFVAHISAFLALGFPQSWLGAAIIVLAGACLAELTRRHLVAAGLAHASVPALLPAVALFLIYSDYRHPLPVALAVSWGLLLSLAFERLPLRPVPARVAVLGLVAAAAFWLGGPGALLVFAVMAMVYGAFVRRDWATVVLALPAGAAIAWLLAEYLFLLPVRQVFLAVVAPSPAAGTGPFPRNLTLVLYGFAPVTVLLVLVGKRLLGRWGQKVRARSPKVRGRHKHAETPQKRLSLAILAKPAWAALPIVLMVLGLYLSHDDLGKPYLLSNYYWHQKQWDKILQLAPQLPKDRTNPFVNHDILLALYHTGRLPYDMFRFPLVPEALLLTHDTWEADLSQLKLSDLFLELGHVNMAQKLASELVATKGNLGPALEEMAWISIVKGQPSTARVYLEALRKDPIRRGTAESLLRGLDNGFTPQQADRVSRIRSYLRDETAGVTGAESVDRWLAALVEHNPRNKMAFEYLMACYLLTGRVDKIAENVKRLEDLGYRSIPTLYEEAVVIHYGALERLPDLARVNVSRETLQRYETFVLLRNSMRPQNQQAVLNRLIRDFGASYFFYYSFGRIGQT